MKDGLRFVDCDMHIMEPPDLFDRYLDPRFKERVILPLYYREPQAYATVMRNAIALNGSFFNTQRMLLQYLTNAYFPPAQVPSPTAVAAPTRS